MRRAAPHQGQRDVCSPSDTPPPGVSLLFNGFWPAESSNSQENNPTRGKHVTIINVKQKQMDKMSPTQQIQSLQEQKNMYNVYWRRTTVSTLRLFQSKFCGMAARQLWQTWTNVVSESFLWNKCCVILHQAVVIHVVCAVNTPCCWWTPHKHTQTLVVDSGLSDIQSLPRTEGQFVFYTMSGR